MLHLTDWRLRNCRKLPNLKYVQLVEFRGVIIEESTEGLNVSKEFRLWSQFSVSS
jgi:hypothetical protein